MHLVWSVTTPAPLRGLALARERSLVLAWDAGPNLSVFSAATGELRAHRAAPGDLAAVCSADDGSAHTAVGQEGKVWLLAPDLTPRWERDLPQRGVAVAAEPFGQFVAASDAGGGLHLLDRQGRTIWQVSNPRPLRYLAFVPEKAVVVGSADFGLVVGFDVLGQCLWRDGLVAHVGSLATNGNGSLIALACYSEGLCCYALRRPRPVRVAQAAPCRLAALSYTGELVLTVGLDNRLCLRRSDGTVRDEFPLSGPPVALALDALGVYAFVALPEGTLLALDLRPKTGHA